uniref:Uncharacterized protein n=1 Tax=Rhodnius prolixus TaxID=13249 RepID=T1IDH4_RHOPR
MIIFGQMSFAKFVLNLVWSDFICQDFDCITFLFQNMYLSQPAVLYTVTPANFEVLEDMNYSGQCSPLFVAGQ